MNTTVKVMLQCFDTGFDRLLLGEPQQLPMVILRELAQAHVGKIETQEAFFFVQAFFNQTHETLVVGLGIQREVEHPIESADLAEIRLDLKLLDIALRRRQIIGVQQWDRQAQRLGLVRMRKA